MDDGVVGMFPKSRAEMIVGTVGEWEGNLRADLRTAVPSVEGDGGLIMTRKGVSVPAEHFAKILEALRKLNGVAASRAVGGRIPKSAKVEVRVSLEPFENDVFCHVRTYYLANERPGQGIAVKARLLPELIALAEQMVETIDANASENAE
jgi:hypothetical protein